jgi:two-component system, sensor histidine kinase and response regulator
VTARKIIVVVDDEPGLCESFQDFFEDEGYDVRPALDGQHALAVLEACPALPCVIVCDVIMPVMDGNELYHRLKQDAALRAVPIVFMTSDPARAPAGELIMKKPVNFDVMFEAVRRYCEGPVSVAS